MSDEGQIYTARSVSSDWLDYDSRLEIAFYTLVAQRKSCQEISCNNDGDAENPQKCGNLKAHGMTWKCDVACDRLLACVI